MAMVELRRMDNRFQADLWRDALLGRGVDCRLRGFHDTAYDGLYVTQKGFAMLLVDEAQLELARQIDAELLALEAPPAADVLALAQAIEHTLLGAAASQADLEGHVAQCLEHGFGAACLSPWLVGRAARLLEGSAVTLCSVVGFPLGIQTRAGKLQEALELAGLGAAELDVVINRGLVASDRLDEAVDEIAAIVAAVAPLVVKAILETSELGPELTARVARAMAHSGAAFLKTGTGHFGPATTADVALLRQNAPGLGVKAAGGIRELDQAVALLEAGASRLGTSSGVQIIEQARLRWPAED
ncbi:deoxyribose-phosphate aldolase [Desulfarculus baarsii]